MTANNLFPSQQEEWLQKGKSLFARPCTFYWAAVRLEELPPQTLPEVAFAGRSNVGKSSLINKLTNHLKLARTSNTPGRTQTLNFFKLANQGILVDLPGYGYASASKEKILNWNNLIQSYLKGRSILQRVFVLIDSRHGLKKLDLEIFETLDKAAVSYQVVLTKTDKISAAEKETVLKNTQKTLESYIAGLPLILMTSSRDGDGIPELQAEIAALFKYQP
ncbi:MAG: ribosome biogenesis GTP-binding protein YihA/YsxC [Alphaproteobacteria bacterium]